MAFSIKNEEADRLARDLAATTGESLTDAVTVALRERLDRQQARGRADVARLLRRLSDEVSALPVLDHRDPDQVVDYDDRGIPR
jgi:antitoxin VapB